MRGKSALDRLGDDEVPPFDPHRQQTPAFLDHAGERDRLLLEFVAPRLDPRQVEDLVDEHQEMLAAGVDVGRIFLVGGHGMRTEQLALHHLGEARAPR